MLFGLLKDPYVSILEEQNEQMRKELGEIRRKEFLTEITKTMTPSFGCGILGGGPPTQTLPPMPTLAGR